MTDEHGGPALSAGERLQRGNPWVAVPIVVGAAIGVVGLIVLIVGVSTEGAGATYLGGPLLGVGALIMVGGFIVAGVEWALRDTRSKRSPVNAESAPPTSGEVQRGASGGAQ